MLYLARIVCVKQEGGRRCFLFVLYLLISNLQCWAKFCTCLLQGWTCAVLSMLLEGWCICYAASLVLRHCNWWAESSAKDSSTLWTYLSVGLHSVTKMLHSPVWSAGNSALWSVLALMSPGVQMHKNTYASPFSSQSYQSNMAVTSCYNKPNKTTMSGYIRLL